MTRAEHTKLHRPSCSEEARRKNGDVHRGVRLSDEQRKRVSEATRQAMADPALRQRLRVKKLGALSPNYGKPKSAETIEKLRLAKRGMKFWNNGQICIGSRTCPGPEWTPGRMKNYEH